MWFRVTQDERPLMVNADKIIKIVAKTDDGKGRGSYLYTSETEYIEVDQGLTEMMTNLGFEWRE